MSRQDYGINQAKARASAAKRALPKVRRMNPLTMAEAEALVAEAVERVVIKPCAAETSRRRGCGWVASIGQDRCSVHLRDRSARPRFVQPWQAKELTAALTSVFRERLDGR